MCGGKHGNLWQWNRWSISQTALLTSTHMTWAFPWYTHKGCQCSGLELKSRKLVEHWQSLLGQRKASSFLKNPPMRKAGELLSLSRNQLRIMKGLLTWHCHLKGYLFKLGLVNSSDRWKEASKTGSHVLCDWQVVAIFRFGHLGHHFMQPDKFQDMPVSRILHLLLGVGRQTHEYKSCTKDQVHGTLMCPPFLYFILRSAKTMCECTL